MDQPQTAGGAYSAPQGPLARFKGAAGAPTPLALFVHSGADPEGGARGRSPPGRTVIILPRCMECLFVCLSNACIVTKRKKAMFRFLYYMKEHLS